MSARGSYYLKEGVFYAYTYSSTGKQEEVATVNAHLEGDSTAVIELSSSLVEPKTMRGWIERTEIASDDYHRVVQVYLCDDENEANYRYILPNTISVLVPAALDMRRVLSPAKILGVILFLTLVYTTVQRIEKLPDLGIAIAMIIAFVIYSATIKFTENRSRLAR